MNIRETSWSFVFLNVRSAFFMKDECSSMPTNAHKYIFINEYSWDFMVIRVLKCPQSNF
jgi:hypothetical protein